MQLRHRNAGRKLVAPGAGIELLHAEDQEQSLERLRFELEASSSRCPGTR